MKVNKDYGVIEMVRKSFMCDYCRKVKLLSEQHKKFNHVRVCKQCFLEKGKEERML